jgi:hypothetical protein
MILRFDEYVEVTRFESRTKEEIEKIVWKTIDEFGLDIPNFRADKTARNMVNYMFTEIKKHVMKEAGM